VFQPTQFLRIALPTPLRRLFDYLPPQGVEFTQEMRGVRVLVPFQSRTLVGILVDVVQETDVPIEKMKAALEILDADPLIQQDMFQLCQWAADYYHYALGEVMSLALPTLLRKGKPLPSAKKHQITPSINGQSVAHELNEAQATAVQIINSAANTFQTFLLDGVTGSGKTEVYLQVISEVLARHQQVLVLVPEISLTPQTILRFQQRFNVPIAALHSNLTEKQRLDAWNAARSNIAKIVIGTRSAIFTPFAHLGLIIVDEEHDHSFKQQDRFRYHARDLAVMRAHSNDIPIVLGSATPSLESLLNVKRERYQHVLLTERAGGALLPTYQVVDMRHANAVSGISNELLQAIHGQLAANNQVMLFLNRRGFAPVLYCTQCAHVMQCRRCDAKLVYHRSPLGLRCHHCDSRYIIPKQCANCRNETMQPVGLGTQRLEQSLTELFPDIPIIRIDRDNTRKKGELQNLLDQIHTTPKAILLGTQMLAKGHHFPNVTMVGIIDADSGLFSVDFRAAEQMGQLLEQVAGRAGRADKLGIVYIQTKHPEHPLLQLLLQKGYRDYAQSLLQERETAALPPYSYFAVLRAEAYKEEAVERFLTSLKDFCTRTFDSGLAL